MKTRKLRILLASSLLVLLALACATFASPTPTPTPVPPTPTVSPTPTPDYEAIAEDGWAALEEEDIQGASDIVDEVLAQDDSIANAWALSGAIHIENGEYVQAIEDLEHALTIDGKDERIIETLTYAYQVRASILILFANAIYDPDAIIEAIHEAREVLDDLKELGDSSNPTTVLNDLLNPELDLGSDENIPDDAYEHFQRAEEFFRNDQFNQAISEYNNAIEDYEDFALAYLYLGDAHYLQGEYEQATEYMLQALDIRPQLVQGWSFLGDAYTELGLPEHAHEAFLNALYLDIENEIAYNGLSRIHNAIGDWESDHFIPYEFTFYIDPSAETSVAGREVFGEPEVEQGGVRIDDSQYVIIIFWQPWELPPVDNEAGGEFVASIFKDDPATTLVGDTFAFEYADAPTVVQLYEYDSPDDEVNRNGITALTTCDDRLFVIQYEYAEVDIDDLVVIVAPYLETFRCDLE